MNRSLEVLINGDHVATLSDQEGVWQLAYQPQWQQNPTGFDLSPRLPRAAGVIRDGASQRHVQWFFDNLLPEEQARQLLASDAKVEFADAFGLLAYYGAESAGALTLLPSAEQQPAGGTRLLTDEALSQRIRNLPRIALTSAAPKRMSLAGAQHKLPVVLDDNVLYEPVANTPSTHILKPDHPERDQYDATVINEWFVMRLAKAASLNVPEVCVHRVPEPVYLIQRFDRQLINGHMARLHVLDACQLLGLDRQFKYQQAKMDTLRTLIGMLRNKAQARIQLFKWLVFNILTGNNDSHLKNLSFFAAADGYYLTPHYDLLSTAVYGNTHTPWLEAELVWRSGQMRTHADVNREDVLLMGEALGLPRRQAGRMMDEVLMAVENAASEHLQACEGLLAGEARLLRRVVHGVIRDMSMRLKGPDRS